MKTFYVTFGMGSVCGQNYLVCYAPDENTLRFRLNEDMKRNLLSKWAGMYTTNEELEKHRCRPLEMAYTAMNIYTSGSCPKMKTLEASA